MVIFETERQGSLRRKERTIPEEARKGRHKKEILLQDDDEEEEEYDGDGDDDYKKIPTMAQEIEHKFKEFGLNSEKDRSLIKRREDGYTSHHEEDIHNIMQLYLGHTAID